jgi:uncharacterized protein YjbI with pentapeptide repeats
MMRGVTRTGTTAKGDDRPPRAAPIARPRISDDLVAEHDSDLAGIERIEDRWIDDADVDADEPVEGLVVRRSRLVGVRFTGATLRAAVLTDVELEGCELSGTTMERCELERVTFVRCRMAGFVAPELRATDLRVRDSRLDEAWLRAATLERCSFEDCAMAGADLYEAHIKQSRFVRCNLDGAELSQAQLGDVALHGSTFDGIRGAAALRNVVIGSDQLVPLAAVVLPAWGVVFDDEYLDEQPR